MVLKSLILKNFRAYKDIEVNFDKNMNVIIGQNDIGKSTILEALDIFFGQRVIKIDVTDLNNEAEEKEISIGVKFDLKNSNKLKIDYFLNKDNKLEIHKKFEIQQKDKKIEETILLRVKDITDLNLTKKQSIRTLSEKYEKGKNGKLNGYKLLKHHNKVSKEILEKLPLYFLFQSDKVNKDTDEDIQKIFRQTTKNLESKEKFQEIINELKEELESKLEDIGKATITKMKDIGLDIPNNIIPKVVPKNLDSFFSFNLESEDISLNKRGSGFRRMITLNYLRAEIENDNKDKNIIYAIEEPETAQHPNQQIKLITALIKLSEKDNHQILLTTHTPEIAKMVNENNLILIDKNEKKNPIVIKKKENKLKLISNTLGIHPFYSDKVVVCFEGEFDIKFIKGINQNIDEYKKIIDLEKENIALIPLQGGNLKNWVDRHYLKNSNIIEVHIYDSDIGSTNENQYENECNKVKTRKDKSYCFMTKKREMENYIHKSLIEEEFGINLDEIQDYNKEDITTYIYNKIPKVKEETIDKKKTIINQIKNRLNGKLSKKITKKHLIELEAFNEIKGWFEKIRELAECK